MPLTREDRKLLHQKAKQPTSGIGKPDNREGYDGDISFRQIDGSGTVEYVKTSGEWVAIASSGEMPPIRIIGSNSSGAGTGVNVHGGLSGLGDDDHTQYLLVDGTRSMNSVMTIGSDADGSDRSITWGHSTLKTIMGIDDSADAFVINTDADFDGTLANNSFSIDANHNVIIAGGLSISGDAALNFTAAGENSIRIPDNQASALIIEEAGNAYLTFVTTDSGEKITLGKKLEAGSVEIEGSAFDIDGGTIDAVTLGTNSAVTEAQIDNININGYIISTANSQTLSVSGGELKLIANQAGTDDAGDNRIRFVDNTTTFGDIKYDDGDTLRLSSASSTDIELYTSGEQINFISNTGSMIFNIDATPEIDVTGNFSIDCSADITLDAAGNDIKFQAGATHELKFTNSSGSWLAAPQTSNASLTLSPNGTGDVICKLGNDVATSTFVVENSSATDRFVVDALGAVVITQASTAANPALKIDSADVDVIGVDINGSQTTANVVDVTSTSATTGNILNITSGALTTGNAIYINHDDSHTEDETVVSFHLDFDKSGVMDDGETGIYTGFDIDMNDAATNHVASNVNMTGIDMDVVSANAQGTLTNLGASFVVTGADTNNGIEITTTDGGTDLKIMSSADSGDYFSIATTAHGATTFTTVDDDAAAANIQITADGTSELAGTTVTLDSSGDIVLSADGDQITMDDGSTTRFTFNVDSTPEIDVTGAFTLDCSDDIEFNADGGNFVFSDGGQQSLNLFVDTGGNVGDAVFKDAGNAEIFRIDGSEDSLRVKNHAQALTNPYSFYVLPTSGCHYTSGVADYQQNFSCVGFHQLEPGANVDNNSWY